MEGCPSSYFTHKWRSSYINVYLQFLGNDDPYCDFGYIQCGVGKRDILNFSLPLCFETKALATSYQTVLAVMVFITTLSCSCASICDHLEIELKFL